MRPFSLGLLPLRVFSFHTSAGHKTLIQKCVHVYVRIIQRHSYTAMSAVNVVDAHSLREGDTSEMSRGLHAGRDRGVRGSRRTATLDPGATKSARARRDKVWAGGSSDGKRLLTFSPETSSPFALPNYKTQSSFLLRG